MAQEHTSVLVLGGGMAGLTAARQLSEAGLEVVLLEARDRVGGRVHTVREDGNVIELGAEFVHGRPQELLNLIEEAGEEIYEVEGSHVSFSHGSLKERDDQAQSLDFLETLGAWTGPDLTFADYLAEQKLDDEQKKLAKGYVEGFNAADHRVISVASLAIQQQAEDAIEGDRGFRIRGGYDRLASFLRRKIEDAGGRVLTGGVVRRVEWNADDVHVIADNGCATTSYRADRCVCALPLGVLQQGDVIFDPAPRALIEAQGLRMGKVCRFTLLFRERFWETLEPDALRQLSFLFSFEMMPRVWWTAHPAKFNTLTGWTGGPDAEALLQLSKDDLASFACDQLATIFSITRSSLQKLLIGCYFHDWDHDPFTRGAYSYVAAGSVDASRAMTIPETGNTLFFAGEHTDTTGHWGTVHAAIRSGMRAAKQILACSADVPV